MIWNNCYRETRVREQNRKRILSACYAFLVPIAKLLLRNGLSFREFEELGRAAFVHVAGKDYGVRGRSTNLSRIAVMTGIPRKEVARVRGLESRYTRDPAIDLSLLGNILHLWATNPKFCDMHGLPLSLPLDGDVSLRELITQCSADLPVGAIRSELLRCRAIEVDNAGCARLVRRHVVSDDFDERLALGLSVSLKALAQTVSFNGDPTRRGPGHIERFVKSEPLATQARDSLRGEIRKRIATASEEFDDLFAEHESPRQPSHRAIGVGFYYWEED
jgi:hypothetical protein